MLLKRPKAAFFSGRGAVLLALSGAERLRQASSGTITQRLASRTRHRIGQDTPLESPIDAPAPKTYNQCFGALQYCI
jgi:hypothetical protein